MNDHEYDSMIFRIYPYHVTVSGIDTRPELRCWCNTNLGDEFKNWREYGWLFVFKNKDDYTLFKLTNSELIIGD